MKFQIEQIALAPKANETAVEFLKAIGLTEWVTDHVAAQGKVFGVEARNVAKLQFNYQATLEPRTAPLELEVIQYEDGGSWLDFRPRNIVSHLGMHVTAEELVKWRELMDAFGVGVAQEVETFSHTNPAIAGKRRYRYVIFSTRHIIGVDLKFIVRLGA